MTDESDVEGWYANGPPYPPEFFRYRAKLFMREARLRSRNNPSRRNLIELAWRSRLVAQRLEAEARGEYFPLMMWGDGTAPTKKSGP